MLIRFRSSLRTFHPGTMSRDPTVEEKTSDFGFPTVGVAAWQMISDRFGIMGGVSWGYVFGSFDDDNLPGDNRADAALAVVPALPVLLVLSLADIVAAIGAWNWRKWGLVLYGISTAAGIAVGLMLTGSQLVVFHDIVPLTILGYLYKDKWAYIK